MSWGGRYPAYAPIADSPGQTPREAPSLGRDPAAPAPRDLPGQIRDTPPPPPKGNPRSPRMTLDGDSLPPKQSGKKRTRRPPNVQSMEPSGPHIDSRDCLIPGGAPNEPGKRVVRDISHLEKGQFLQHTETPARIAFQPCISRRLSNLRTSSPHPHLDK